MEKKYKRVLNARAHKERSVPKERRKYGHLERKKDYKIRAAQQRKNKEQQKKQQEKILQRNPDEFTTKIVGVKTKDGEHIIERKAKTYTNKELVEIKNKDINYFKYKKSIEEKKANKLKGILHGLDIASKTPRTHVIYVDNDKEIKNFNPETFYNTIPELLPMTYNRLTKEQLNDNIILNRNTTPEVLNELSKEQSKQYEDIVETQGRIQEISKVLNKIQQHKNLRTTKGRVTKIITKDVFGDEIPEKTVYRWRRERK